ncbi:DUF563 domain-containing protein [Roseomonas sp. 18066]|uniref:glycosyltransferase family 61 protein n=1 Tax=Roseomonas sp. 18066 TaxID=2681412 RepID=UPI001359AE99|nr:glycosyltransferase family 61 protein [Roseomonas sp. 18066]
MTLPQALGLSYLAEQPRLDSLDALLAAPQGAWEASPAEAATHPWFPTFRAGATPAPPRLRQTRRPAIRLAVLQDALVLPGGLVIDQASGTLVADSINGMFEADPAFLHHMRPSLHYQGVELDIAARRATARKPWPAEGETLEAPVMHLTYRSDLNYTHFMLEVLPKLLYWRMLPAPRPRLLVSKHVQQHLAPLLALYGVAPEALLAVPDPRQGKAWRVRRLYLGAPLLWTRPEPVRMLRSEAERTPLPPGAPRRFYIARPGKKNWFRRLLNEGAVLAELTRLGFVPLVLEHYSLAQQASLFRQADCVAGVYGGGLFNAIHAPPGARILSLTSPDYHRAILDSLPPEEALRGVTVVGDSFSCRRDRNNSPFVLDLAALRAACQALALG